MQADSKRDRWDHLLNWLDTVSLLDSGDTDLLRSRALIRMVAQCPFVTANLYLINAYQTSEILPKALVWWQQLVVMAAIAVAVEKGWFSLNRYVLHQFVDFLCWYFKLFLSLRADIARKYLA